MFDNRVIFILVLSWNFIKGNLVFSSHEGSNLQKILMLRVQYAEVKIRVGGYRKCISQGTIL